MTLSFTAFNKSANHRALQTEWRNIADECKWTLKISSEMFLIQKHLRILLVKMNFVHSLLNWVHLIFSQFMAHYYSLLLTIIGVTPKRV